VGPSDFCVGPADEADKYRLIHQVGSGGGAQLWKAEPSVSGTWEPVAVKVLRADRLGDIDRWKARWAEQAEVLRFIRHRFESAAIGLPRGGFGPMKPVGG